MGEYENLLTQDKKIAKKTNCKEDKKKSQNYMNHRNRARKQLSVKNKFFTDNYISCPLLPTGTDPKPPRKQGKNSKRNGTKLMESRSCGN